MECIETISQAPEGGFCRHQNVKIFNRFDINEDDNDIIEYHGDIDRDKCYFNEELQLLY